MRTCCSKSVYFTLWKKENGLPIKVLSLLVKFCFCVICFILSVSGLDKREPEEESTDLIVLAPDLIRIIESSILTFHSFMKMEKKKSSGPRHLFGNHNQIATSLQQVQSSLEKVKFL